MSCDSIIFQSFLHFSEHKSLVILGKIDYRLTLSEYMLVKPTLLTKIFRNVLGQFPLAPFLNAISSEFPPSTQPIISVLPHCHQSCVDNENKIEGPRIRWPEIGLITYGARRSPRHSGDNRGVIRRVTVVCMFIPRKAISKEDNLGQ